MSDYVYAYQAALYCEDCGDKIRAELTAAGKAPEDPDDESSYNSDDFPTGPYPTGEADCPQYCDGCHEFLENDLTAEGIEIVKSDILEAIRRDQWESEPLKVWADFYNIPLPAKVGQVELINPSERSWAEHRYLIWAGQCAPHYFMIWANSFDDASEYLCDWCVENAPGLLCDEEVAEEYKRQVALGISHDEAMQIAELDCTVFGHAGIHYMHSWEWGGDEDPSREQVLELVGRE
jgi:hypothetical protein